MPEKKTLERAKKAKLARKSPSTQAGEFVREEIEHVRQGKHGARSAKQVIAIGLSKARRAGVALKPPAKGSVSEKTRKSAESAYKKGQSHEPIFQTRAVGRENALKREPRAAASKTALSRQVVAAAKKRGPVARSMAAKKAAATKGLINRSAAAKKGAQR
ncbi:MAG: hypothetical protein LLG04_10200 [Parachlamydia sp.]|nr:hypothetical protein [Parachlamydia sp.]